MTGLTGVARRGADGPLRDVSPTVLSAFSGVGGLDLGLEAAGFAHVGCIEIDESARNSLKANRDGVWPLLEPGDIAALANELTSEAVGLQAGELAVLAGGPPCQPFSKAAQWSALARQGLNDVRSHCLRDFLRLAEVFLPHVVLIENVSGFVQGPVSALSEIERSLRTLNQREGTAYALHHRVVEAADYGVPQRRSRAIIVAFRDGSFLPWPRASHIGSPTTAWDALGTLPAPDAPPTAVGKWAELLPSIPEGSNYQWHTAEGGGRPLFGYRTRFWSFLLKLAKDQPSWTLPAQPGPATGPFHWSNRPLTITEMLRLQSFPPDWIVEGERREQVRQVGNATPPLLAEKIGRAIGTHLYKWSYDRGPRYSIRRVRTIPAATPPTTVPKKFRSLEGQHARHPGTGNGPRPRR